MEDEHKKNTEIDWGSIHEEQVKTSENSNKNYIQNTEKNQHLPSIQENHKKFSPPPNKSSKKKLKPF